jgi:KDO2-lipid IV(A) lauroyltransferase
LFDWFVRLRNGAGITVVPADSDTVVRVTEALKRNALACLPADRDLSGNGVEVMFFGERTTLPAGPALLSLRTGAALLPTCVYQRADGRIHGVVGPPLQLAKRGTLRDDLTTLTQMLAAAFEAQIAAAPEQWHLFQPNWPSDRVETRPASTAVG